MDFTFSPEQEALREAVRSYLTKATPPTYVREMIEDSRGFRDAWWEGIVELGWPGLVVPEALGGVGLGMVDLVVVQEEMGRLAMPGPFLSSAVCATIAARRLGDEELMTSLASGRVRGTLALEEVGAGDPLLSVTATATETPAISTFAATSAPQATSAAAPVTPAATAAQTLGGWTLHGTKPVVIDGHTADVAIVAARTDEGMAAFALDAPSGQLVGALDVTRKVARVDLEGRTARRLGPEGDQRGVLERVNDDIAVALCAESVGASERALHMAIEYSKARVQFDRPIATFQAIKHKIVDMLHQLELARVGTHWAAWASQVDDEQRGAAAAMCKGFVGEAANMITAENIQVHGGVGFTWDVDCHLLFRRVKQNDVLFGRQGWQRQRLADLVLGPA